MKYEHETASPRPHPLIPTTPICPPLPDTMSHLEKLNLVPTRFIKPHLRRQTSNLIPIRSEHIRQHGILPRRDLRRQIDILLEHGLALLERAVEIDVLDLVAEIGFLVDERDESVFDLEVHFCAVFDPLFEGAGCGDDEGFAAMRG